MPRRRSSAQPVRLHPGQRPDQGGLAVVDVPGGRDDVHVSPARRSPAARTARCSARSSAPLHRPQVEQAAAAGDPAQDRGSPARSGVGAAPRAGSRPRWPAPPRARRRRRPRPRCRPDRVQPGSPDSRPAARPASAASTGSAAGTGPPARPAPPQRRLQRGQRQLVHAQRPGQRVPPQPVTTSLRPSSSPACGPPSSLSPLRGDQRGPARSEAGRVRLGGQPRTAPAARSRCRPPRGTPSAASSATGTAAVNPSTRKFDGCTLSTNAVCGPSAAA